MYALEVKRISNFDYSNILHINERISEYKYYSLVTWTKSFHKITTVWVNGDCCIKVIHALALK